MPAIHPSLFKLIGAGFIDDAYAVDANYLRWMFDPRLGFPRFAFCLERRPGLDTEQGQSGVERFTEAFIHNPPPESTTTGRISRSGVAVFRPGSTLTLTSSGILLDGRPVILDFHGGSALHPEPYACWARLTLRAVVPGGSFEASARYVNRGEEEAVDLQGRRLISGGRFAGLTEAEVAEMRVALEDAEQIQKILDRPQLGPTRPQLRNPALAQVYRKLLRANPNRYERVTPGYLQTLLDALKDRGLVLDDLHPGRGIVKTFHVVLRAERIDRIAVTGKQAWLNAVEWVRSEDLMRARDWQPVACFPMPTEEDDYLERNQDFFAGLSVEETAQQRIFDPSPQGAEPLDDPQVPPSRPPKPEELELRYMKPWFEYLEPWLRQVLEESASGDFHQAESRRASLLNEAGQARGEGVPSEIAGHPVAPAIEARPYEMLLSAANAFTTARLLGLAAVDKPPEALDAWDYRVRGRWRLVDILAWGNKLARERDRLLDELGTASPFDFVDVQARLLEKLFEIGTTNAFFNMLSAMAVDDVVELWALKIGVRMADRGLYSGPVSLSAAYDGLSRPIPGEALAGIARLEWPLRARARVIVDEDVPLGAALGRGDAGGSGPYPHLLNPTEPLFGVHLPVIPAGPQDAPGESGTAVFFDRRAEEAVDYRYGVSEVDPFGRWSRFTETNFRWDNEIPPLAPVQVSAELDQVGSPPALELTVTFAWPTDFFPPEDHTFLVYFRRDPPPSDSPRRPDHWQHCEREAGTGAGPYTFVGTFSGNDSHDGMPVTVGFSDRSETDPSGTVLNYRDYTLAFNGIVLERDALDRAKVWVGIAARDAAGLESDEVGGPARAEHILEIPPPVPPFPPEPELATFADAQGQSSYTLHWNGAANLRYSVYRTGERELIQLLQDRGVDVSVYRPDDPDNLRAAALKSLAPQARDAFQPRSELIPAPPAGLDPVDWPDLPAGPHQFTDQLPGLLRTLSIYAVLGRSRAGVLSDWPASPDRFVVVKVPHIPQPSRPVVVRAGWRPPADPPPAAVGPDSARVELLIAEPAQESADVAAYEVYRTLDPLKAEDYRRMRPLHRLDSPVYEEDSGTSEHPTLRRTPVAVYIDPTVLPWRTYYYRIVARATGMNGAANGTRSEASAPVKVSTYSGEDPQPPTGLSAILGGGILEVTFEADAPVTPVGEFNFSVLQLDAAGPILLARVSANQARQAVPTQFRVEVSDTDLASGDQIAVRIQDPFGRRAQSAALTLT